MMTNEDASEDLGDLDDLWKEADKRYAWSPCWQLLLMNKFSCEYERRWDGRNKMKNLRCFPCCGIDGKPGAHRERGFCGAAVMVEASPLPGEPPISSHHRLRAFGVLCERRPEMDSMFRGPGGAFEQEIEQLKFTECELASREENGVVELVMPGHREKWDYGWVSSKHKKDVQHSIYLFLFEELDQGWLRLLGCVGSAPFTLTSSRTMLRRKRDREDDQASFQQSSSSSSPEPTAKQKRLDESKKRLLLGLLRLCREEREKSLKQQNKRSFMLEKEVIPFIHAPLFAETLLSSELQDVLFDGMDEVPLEFGEPNEASQGSFVASPDVSDVDLDFITLPLLDETMESVSSKRVDKTREEARVNALINSVVDNEQLSKKVDLFFASCLYGPAGESLEQSLNQMPLGGLKDDPFARGLAQCLFKKFEESLDKALEEVIADRKGLIKDIKEEDMAMLEEFMRSIPNSRRKLEMRNKFFNVVSVPKWRTLAGCWTMEPSEVDQSVHEFVSLLSAKTGFFNKIVATALAKAFVRMELRLENKIAYLLAGVQNVAANKQFVLEFHFDEKEHEMPYHGPILWFGSMPRKFYRASLKWDALRKEYCFTVLFIGSALSSAIFYSDYAPPPGQQDYYVSMRDTYIVSVLEPNTLNVARKIFEFETKPELDLEGSRLWHEKFPKNFLGTSKRRYQRI